MVDSRGAWKNQSDRQATEIPVKPPSLKLINPASNEMNLDLSNKSASFKTTDMDIAKFAPCRCVPFMDYKPLREHPALVAIRNKRHRRRMLKKYKRFGIHTYMVRGWKIHPVSASTEQPTTLTK
jgi:hypothetical protein